MSRFQWQGADRMVNRIGEYGEAIHFAVRQVAEYFRAVLETYAKENAPWEDRTANARQTLHALVDDLAKDVVALYLSHGVTYGLWLEIANGGKYAVIWPTIEAHLEAIAKMLKGIFGNATFTANRA